MKHPYWIVLAILASFTFAAPADAVDLLGSATSFAVLGSSAVTNTNPTVLNGDLGVWPGDAITGFPPGVVNGTTYLDEAVAMQAQSDVTVAYNTLTGMPLTQDLTGQDLGGLTLTPGVYFFASSAQLTGPLTLNAQNNPDALFVFRIGSTLTTASNSSVVVINGVNPCNVYWRIGSSATLGTATAFKGSILALASITLNTGATIEDGRALARTGAVTMDTNVITAPTCAPASIGACCLPSGSCKDVTAVECAKLGGLWREGSRCKFHPCPPPTGACCLPDGSCQVATRSECRKLKGTYQANGTTCKDVKCAPPTGACCYHGVCRVVTEERCSSIGGVFQGTGTSCHGNPCNTDGACCFANGDCKFVKETRCVAEGGVFQGIGMTCEKADCLQRTQGCCLPWGACTPLVAEACIRIGGVPQGDGTKCETVTCLPAPRGACCHPNGDCKVTAHDDCLHDGGVYRGEGTTCDHHCLSHTPSPEDLTKSAGSNTHAIELEMPRAFALGSNSPNPFERSTTVLYALPEPSRVRISVYNVVGQEISVLVEGAFAAGRQSATWDVTRPPGDPLSNGVYFYRMEAQGLETGQAFLETKKMVLMRK
ncbi:MAG: ice-binding family protein [bacterium]